MKTVRSQKSAHNLAHKHDVDLWTQRSDDAALLLSLIHQPSPPAIGPQQRPLEQNLQRSLEIEHYHRVWNNNILPQCKRIPKAIHAFQKVFASFERTLKRHQNVKGIMRTLDPHGRVDVFLHQPELWPKSIRRNALKWCEVFLPGADHEALLPHLSATLVTWHKLRPRQRDCFVTASDSYHFFEIHGINKQALIQTVVSQGIKLNNSNDKSVSDQEILKSVILKASKPLPLNHAMWVVLRICEGWSYPKIAKNPLNTVNPQAVRQAVLRATI